METWEAALQARTELQAYAENAIGLFALALHFNVDDLDSVAADAITDGSDDKKCDLAGIGDLNHPDGTADSRRERSAFMRPLKEKRKHTREKSEAKITVSWSDGVAARHAVGTLVDIGGGGAQITLPAQFPSGSAVAVAIPHLQLLIHATVRYCNQVGRNCRIGIEITSRTRT